MTAPAWTARSAVLLGLLLLLLPLLTVALGLDLSAARGPVNLAQSFDPDFVYLLTGLNLLYGDHPGYVGQPGTPLQVFCAGISGLRYLARGEGRLADDVLLHAEDYLECIRLSQILAYGAILWLAGLVALRLTRSPAAALLVQSSPFLSLTLLQELPRVRPEAALLPFCALYGLSLLRWCWAAPPARPQRAAGWGFLSGITLAIKITFLPFLLAPLAILRGRGPRLWYAAGAAAGFGLGLLPAWSRSDLFFARITRIATHSGIYGSGQPDLLNPWNLYGGTLKLARAAPELFALVAAGLLVAGLSFLLRRRRQATAEAPPEGRPHCPARAAAWLAAGAVLLVFFVGAKQPESRYLMPFLGLIGPFLALLAASPAQGGGARLLPAGFGASLALFAALGALNTIRLRGEFDESERLREQHLLFQRLVRSPPFGRYQVVCYQWCSGPLYGRKYALEFNNNRFSNRLARLFPDAYFYNCLDNYYFNFHEQVPWTRIAGRSGEVLFWGKPFAWQYRQGQLPLKYLPRGLILQPLVVLRREALYRLAGYLPDRKAPGRLAAP